MRGSGELIVFTILFVILAILASRPEKAKNAFRIVMGFGFLLCVIMVGLTIVNCSLKALVGLRLFNSLYC